MVNQNKIRTITDIIPISKKKSRVYLDEEFAFVLCKGELLLFDMNIGGYITEGIYQELINVFLFKRAKRYLLYLLGKSSYTEKQLRGKFESAGYPDCVIDETIAYGYSYSYIDDELYARNYITNHITKKSRQAIFQTLYIRGIPLELSSQIYTEIHDENDGGNMDERQIHNYLRKKNYSKDDDTSVDAKHRMFNHLLRKGFPVEMIKANLF